MTDTRTHDRFGAHDGSGHDPEALVAYLYGECDPAEEARVAVHLAQCARCADEVASLSGVRRELSHWTPPESTLGFQLSRPQPAAVLRPARWWNRPLPAWAQAAAAVLVFGAGLWIGGAGRSAAGQGAPDQSAAAKVADTQVAGANERSVADLARLVDSLLAEMTEVKQALSARPAGAQAASLQIVKTLIDESEQRVAATLRRDHRIELTARLAEFASDMDLQQRGATARLNNRIVQIQGQTNTELRRQGALLQNVAVSGAQPRN